MILGIEVVLGILVFLILAYIAFIVYVNWPNDTPLVKDIRVTQEWTEVDISPALRPTKRVQEINLRIHNFKTDLRPHSFKITLRNGTVIEPEIELYDEYGGKFEMHHSGFVRKNYDDIVFSPGRPTDNKPESRGSGFMVTDDGDIVYSPSKEVTKLFSDRTYTKLRIRSDIPFTCNQVYWRDCNPK